MNQAKRPARSKLRVCAGIIIGVLAAALSPALIGTSSVVFIYPVLTLAIYAFAGTAASICAMAANILAMDLYLGTPGTIVSLSAFALPAGIMIRGVNWRRPIGSQMRAAITAQVLGVALALVALRIYIGADIIDVFVNMLRGYMEQASPGLLDTVLVRFFNSELLPNGADLGALTEGFLTSAQRADYMDAFMGQLNNSLALSLPGALLSASAVTAIMSVLIANFLLRREPGREMCYIPVSRWFTPWQVSLGLTITLAVAYVLYSAGLKGADSMYMALLALLRTAFMIQAAISLERHLRAMERRRWTRIILIALLLIFVPTAAVIYGAFSAMFGVHGAFKQLRLRKHRGNGDDDI